MPGRGILPVDIAVIGEDPLWVTTTMNHIVDQLPGIYVREYATVLQALDHLVPGHPAVVVCAPDALDDAATHLADISTDRPELQFVFATDEGSTAAADQLRRRAGAIVVGSEDPAIATETERLLHHAQETVAHEARLRGLGAAPTGPHDQTTDATDAERLIVGPDPAMRIVAVSSGKGGTGTTTFTLNLAAALAAESGSRVTVIDAHGLTGDVGLLLGLPKPDVGSLDDVEIDESSIEHYTVVHEPSSLRALSLPHDETILETLQVRDLLELLIALDQHTDITVIDAPLGLLVASDLVTFANAVVLVSTAHLPSLKNTRIAADAIGREAALALVLNDTTTKGPDPGRGAVERFVQVELVAELPFDDHIAEGASAAPVNALSPASSKYAKRVAELARTLLEHNLA